MQYLKIHRSKRQIRANGSTYAVPLIIKKNKKFGKVISEKSLSRKKCILVTGGHDSGKTRWLSRLYTEDKKIWAKFQNKSLYLDAISPLSAWYENNHVMQWWNKHIKTNKNLLPWVKLKAWEKQEKLADYLIDHKSLLFLDNAHKLTGRKLQLAKQCLIASKIFIMAASDEERLPPSIRHLVLRRDPQIIRLGTETAYDGTQTLMFIIALVALGAGWWEISLIVGGLTALSKNRRSSKQN